MALTNSDLTNNATVGVPYPHAKPLKAVKQPREKLHGDLTANSQVGAPRAEPVNIMIGNTNLIDILVGLGYTGPTA